MKNVLYILIVLIMGANFTSCSTDPIDEEFPIEGTVGEDDSTAEDEEEEEGDN
jgi:hypothetical protein